MNSTPSVFRVLSNSRPIWFAIRPLRPSIWRSRPIFYLSIAQITPLSRDPGHTHPECNARHSQHHVRQEDDLTGILMFG